MPPFCRWLHEPDIPMGTLKKRIEDPREIADPNVVKVVTDRSGNAIYFSRCPIPYTATADPAARPPTSNTSACTSTGAIFCCGIPTCPSGRWNRPNGWSSCARSKTASRSAWSKPNTNRWAWIRPRIWNRVSHGCSKPRFTETGEQTWIMAKYIFVTGGVVSSLGKGHRRGVHRLPAGKPRPESHLPEIRPLSQRRSRHHEPVPARRGVRHRRRRRDRSRPGPLRALHPRPAHAEQQPHLAAASTSRSSRASAAAIIWAKPCR